MRNNVCVPAFFVIIHFNYYKLRSQKYLEILFKINETK